VAVSNAQRHTTYFLRLQTTMHQLNVKGKFICNVDGTLTSNPSCESNGCQSPASDWESLFNFFNCAKQKF
jgi:hypothetical protein